jgi:hypothetical protein
MALKIEAQARPGAATLTQLYQVPVSKAAISSSIIVCNTDLSNDDFFTIYAVPSGGGSPTVANAIFNDVVPYLSSFVAVVGLSLEAGATIWIISTNGRLTFTMSGDES